MENVTLVGKIINTHGIKGNLKLYPYTDDPNRFKQLSYLLLGEDLKEYALEESFVQKSLAYVKLKGFDNINDVLNFVGLNVYIRDEDRVELPKDRYFISDIVGMSVFDLKGNYYGTVKDVLETGANDVYEILNDEGKMSYLPAIKEFVLEVNVENKKLIVNPIEGLFS
ncbi:ribosome maturation factor RimM [Peptoniphilus sp. GNH]|nr:16S rRNA processing protein RimM [Clostridiales bacterium KA00134]UHR03061.1 ribosome maturation factor RimM [Peptoniphilus sp. GNH]